jgi:hypothetical protein
MIYPTLPTTKKMGGADDLPPKPYPTGRGNIQITPVDPRPVKTPDRASITY